jgi:hypothetical protein
MPTFTDAPEKKFTLLPEGDYVLCVTDFEIGISTSKKTAGSEKYSITFEVEGNSVDLKEMLFDHESCLWKLEAFLKSSGIALKKGEAYEFRKDKADMAGIRWIDPIGLRCHAKLGQEPYTTTAGKNITVNKIAIFYTDRPKLPPRRIEDDVPFQP